MLKAKNIKPLTKHRDLCIRVGLDTTLIKGLIRAYYNNIADGLVIQTIQTMTLLSIATVGIILILILTAQSMSLLHWWTLLTIAITTLVIIVIGALDSTANARITRILEKIEKNGESNLQCFGIPITKRYKPNNNTYVIEAQSKDDTIKISVEDIIYERCITGSKILLFCYGDDVLFVCPVKFLDDFLIGPEPGTRKITVSDVKEYYSIRFSTVWEQLKEMFKDEREHYSKCLDDLKKRK